MGIPASNKASICFGVMLLFHAAGFSQTAIDVNPFLSISGIGNQTMNAVHAFTLTQDHADQQYDSGKYQGAFSTYRRLAEIGDKFSQYRLAFMLEHGQGVDENLVQAFAWAYVAAEAGHRPLVDYFHELEDRLPAAQLEPARTMAQQYLQDYGLFAQALKAKEAIREELRKCTGSHIGLRCDRVDIQGTFTCGITQQGLPGRNCLALGSVGVPSIVGEMPARIREVQQRLDLIMQQYSPGTVELRELEVVDDETNATESGGRADQEGDDQNNDPI